MQLRALLTLQVKGDTTRQKAALVAMLLKPSILAECKLDKATLAVGAAHSALLLLHMHVLVSHSDIHQGRELAMLFVSAYC